MTTIRVYRYGLLPPHENAERVEEQMRLAHRYRNVLTEIERARRVAIRAASVAHAEVAAQAQAVKAADAVLAEALLSAARAKSASRSSKAPQEIVEAVKAARSAKREAVKAFRTSRASQRLDAAAVAEADTINARAAWLVRNARAYCGVYWGSYLIVEDAMEAARKAPLYDGAEPNDPRFVRWSGDGMLGVQLQNGETADAVDGGLDTRLRIEPGSPPPKADPNSKRSQRRRFAVLAMRVGSEGRDPIFARWRCVMHRPLPDGAVIKRAAVMKRMCGPRAQWSVTITVVIPDVIRQSATTGTVAVDIGWRQMPDSVRVAAWRSDSGQAGFFTLPESVIGQLRKADELRSVRDDAFNAARDALVTALGGIEVPEWIRDASRTLALWRSPGRLAALTRRWRDARFDGDEEVYARLEAWRYHDHHLWEWETSQRAKALRHRREIYRCFAADLARKYAVLVLEDFDLRDIARRPAMEVAAENEHARSTRHLVATSELRMALTQAFRSRGGTVEAYPAEYTTQTCSACFSVEHWDQAGEVMHTCGACGARWDQDDNATRNLLREHAGAATKAMAGSVSPETVKESRWQRAARLRSEKDARAATARN